MLENIESIHFVGIGGIGMSGIAYILLKSGYQVSGSDQNKSSITNKLKMKGARIFIGHDAKHIIAQELVVYSTAISESNPELIEARKRKIPIIHRAELLAKIANNKKSIFVTGCHGKTTVTSMIAHMLIETGYDPTVIVGGEISSLGGNARLGASPWFVAEADESDKSFLKLNPYFGIITNIDEDHLEHYENLENIINTFLYFAERIDKSGRIFCCIDNNNVKELISKLHKEKFKTPITTYGMSKNAEIRAEGLICEALSTRFDVYKNAELLGSFTLSVPGKHNVLNALSAIALGVEIGLSFDAIRKAMQGFKGVDRRFQIKANIGDVMVVNDYAHHPTEIQAVLETAKNLGKKRIVAVFQPHRYTRTGKLYKQFAVSLSKADKVILTDVYSAGEAPIKGANTDIIFNAMKNNGYKNAVYIPDKSRILSYLSNTIEKGDIILCMGAGDISAVAEGLADKLI
ncbi:MAG: UDP-N-acetylmuramate--L-alanine ligase [bacterium]|nr:UDP-N-acetylmuramate--L-alanine ligase [bacterium]